jgi:hypothetical protein
MADVVAGPSVDAASLLDEVEQAAGRRAKVNRTGDGKRWRVLMVVGGLCKRRSTQITSEASGCSRARDDQTATIGSQVQAK